MTFGSLFSGIGGADLGLERAGMECMWQVEIDPYCLKVLEKHWPNVERYSDVKHFATCGHHAVDVIVGGFPCQDISHMGLGAGLASDRSGLWFEMLRIVRAIRPRYVFVENVSALLTRGLGRVLAGLAESGYSAEWDSICAGHFGAPHERERLFILAYPDQGDGSEGMGPEQIRQSAVFAGCNITSSIAMRVGVRSRQSRMDPLNVSAERNTRSYGQNPKHPWPRRRRRN